ncbi:hypothetical protein Micbo1qcDRAFT_158968, partial [Microdochium bolleyi]
MRISRANVLAPVLLCTICKKTIARTHGLLKKTGGASFLVMGMVKRGGEDQVTDAKRQALRAVNCERESGQEKMRTRTNVPPVTMLGGWQQWCEKRGR